MKPIRHLNVLMVLATATLPMAAVSCQKAALQEPVEAQDPMEAQEPMEALPEHLIYLYSATPNTAPADSQRQLYANRKWEPGRQLKVCLFGGNDVVATLIRQAAGEWNNYGNFKLDFGPAGGWYNCLSPQGGYFQIRIGFSSQGYWSAVGNDSEMRLDALAPSMNLEGFNRLYSPSTMQAVEVLAKARPYHVATIKHEFGHALGLLHELQNPTLNCHDEIKWDGPGSAFEYFKGPPNFWTEDQVRRNLGFIQQTDPDFNPGDPDPKSIMMYSLPAKIFKRGNASPCYVGVNFEISEKDKAIVRQIYPAADRVANLPSDVELAAATVRPIAAVASPMEVTDNTQRVLADLESTDPYTRRNARAQLANLIGQLPQAKATELIKKTSSGSYRQQLGVAVAVANAPADLQLTDEAKSVLNDKLKTANDATLRTQLERATREVSAPP